MKHTVEDFNKTSLPITENIGEQDIITGSLAEMVTMFSETVAEGTAFEKRVAELESENERLKNANLSLYLKTAEIKAEDKPKEKEKTEETGLKFEDLFNDKGELK